MDNAGTLLPGLTPIMGLADTYTTGNRTQLATEINGATNDFVNNYWYTSNPVSNPLGLLSEVTQTGNSNGGDAVAAKTATFQYDRQGELTGVGRYQDATGSSADLVAQAAYGYDLDGNLLTLGYSGQGTSVLPSYTYTYDPLGNMATSWSTLDGSQAAATVAYASDSTGQLLSASGGSLPSSETYSYLCSGQPPGADFSAAIRCPGTEKRVGGAGGGASSPCSPARCGRKPGQDARRTASGWRFALSA